MGEAHILIHEQMLHQESASLKAGAARVAQNQGLGSGETPPQVEGQATGDLISAGMGERAQ